MNTIISFYKGWTPDQSGRYITEILDQDDYFLESCHDYIQWLFPNKELSQFNPDAPLLTDEVIKEFKARPELRVVVKKCLDRMIKFYQLDREHPWWATKNNHNYLRITRILNTLKAFEMKDEASDFYTKLFCFIKSNQNIVGAVTIGYWHDALSGVENLYV